MGNPQGFKVSKNVELARLIKKKKTLEAYVWRKYAM
jgi:hypothetical protein